MMNFIDDKLNKVTMYRLVLYYLIGLLASATVLGSLGLLPYNPLALVISTAYITIACVATNAAFSRFFKAPTNVESVYITALILVFIITPMRSFADANFLLLGLWASVLAMASKYILAIRKKHVFNPAAVAVLITSLAFGLSASWWIGTPWMALPVVFGGWLMTRKLLRSDLVYAFFASAAVTLIASLVYSGSFSVVSLERFLFSSPLFFFAFIMLTEPLTTPPTRFLRIVYGALVGFLFVPTIHLGPLYTTPEIALVLGNIFAYIVSPKEKLMLRLMQIKEIANDTYDFIFALDAPFSFKPGQYMEWTLAHENPDNRGNRRYFTLASSPLEQNVRIGLKFYPKMSSYKRSLLRMQKGDTIVASGRSGDFVMPRNKKKKLAFIAGGIGITPFRSMLRYLLDTNGAGGKRDIVLFYSNKTLGDVAYTDVFDYANEALGVKTVYTLTDAASVPASWGGERGMIDAEMIRRNVPDFADRLFYLSGPHSMVSAFEAMLLDMGVSRDSIKKDFFPGFA